MIVARVLHAEVFKSVVNAAEAFLKSCSMSGSLQRYILSMELVAINAVVGALELASALQVCSRCCTALHVVQMASEAACGNQKLLILAPPYATPGKNHKQHA